MTGKMSIDRSQATIYYRMDAVETGVVITFRESDR